MTIIEKFKDWRFRMEHRRILKRLERARKNKHSKAGHKGAETRKRRSSNMNDLLCGDR